MLVHDHMTPRPITLRLDADFKSALKVMEQHAIHHLPVVDAGGNVVGVITETDIFKAFVRMHDAVPQAPARR